MVGRAISGIAALLAISAFNQTGVAWANGQDARQLLQQELTGKVPSQWQVHVTWRDTTLLAFVTPYPYQQASDLWYDPDKLQSSMRALCPDASDSIWTQLTSAQGIAVEPTVGGKGGDALRLACPRNGKPGT